MSIGLVSYGLAGHRQEYIEFFTALIDRLNGRSKCFRKWQDVILLDDSAFFLMIEEDFFGFSLCGIMRSAFGRKTVGLLFRGREAANPKSAAQMVKAVILRCLKNIKPISVISIVPFSVAPEVMQVASHSIYDPQLWDQIAKFTPTSSSISQDIIAAANGRKIVVALGRQDDAKGFNWFCELWKDEAIRQQYLFASAGKITPNFAEVSAEFSRTGGYCVDRHIDHNELMALYQAADFVWAAYPPNYDQASGIMGRAVQFCVPVIVREGSVSQRVLLELSAEHVAIEFGMQVENVAKLLKPRPRFQIRDVGNEGDEQKGVTRARNSAISVLRSVLGL